MGRKNPTLKHTQVEALGKVLGEQLTIYGEDVTRRVNEASARAVKDLVKITQETAPLGKRRGGNYAASITSGIKHKTKRGTTYVWYVKAPNYRLTHLLVHGHATRNGRRTKANSFLAKALDKVLPRYEEEVQEAVKP